MAKKILGDACAFIPGVAGNKNRYMKIGIAMTDGDRISLKLDTLPLPGTGWEGWVNIFPNSNDMTNKPVPRFAGPVYEDDIPF
ncbi:MAG TPA: hypothetical protein DCQ33_11010 [Nitrospira sp.]|nr:hypothetical protein [Nitrospira sp.]